MNVDKVFLSKSDLIEFGLGQSKYREGICYTWEEEFVSHLFLTPNNHSYGNTTKIIFKKEKPSSNDVIDNYSFIVYSPELPENDTSVVVYKVLNNSLVECDFEYIPTQKELYSRNKGLLEVDVLKDKRVTVIGLGSFGAQISVELAKAGVGHFALFDFDRIELHNLVRHIATLHDLGRLKTNVLKDAIVGKNPFADVQLFPININDNIPELEKQIQLSDIVICATDNNQSRFIISSLLKKYKKVGIYGGAITRAEGGHVFVQRPNEACYCCLIGNDFFKNQGMELTNIRDARINGQIAAYVSPEDAEAMIQVGLATDIEPLSNMVTKLALVELSRGTNSGISSLEDEFTFNYYFWANRREREYVHMAPFKNCGNKPTIMRWYGANIPQNTQCALCSDKVVLDEGSYIPVKIQDKVELESIELDLESARIK